VGENADMTSPEVGNESAVVVDQLTVVRGGTTALKGVGFALEPGTLTGLLGPSGAGKTTLMRAIVGVQIITAGTVTVLGRPSGVAALRDRVGYVTQDPSVYPDLSVRQNLRYFAKVLGAPSSDIDRVIEEVQLQPQSDQVVSTLSGGERSRVSLATALLGNPELLVLDEPTVGLDPVLRRDLWDLFGRLAERGVTLLVSSHVMDEATRCHRLLLLRQAELLADGTLAQLQALTGQADPEQVFLHLIDNGVQGPPGGPAKDLGGTGTEAEGRTA
jgi:ABC-2 type transport system ATP-binding protein